MQGPVFYENVGKPVSSYSIIYIPHRTVFAKGNIKVFEIGIPESAIREKMLECHF
jgi:hypothetical protein